MAWVERTRRRLSTAVLLVLLATLLVAGTGVAASKAFARSIGGGIRPARARRPCGRRSTGTVPGHTPVLRIAARQFRVAAAAIGAGGKRRAGSRQDGGRNKYRVIGRHPSYRPTQIASTPGPIFDAWLDATIARAGSGVDPDALREAAVRACRRRSRNTTPGICRPSSTRIIRRGGAMTSAMAVLGRACAGASAVVLEVFAGSPAERAGLQIGDHILAIDGATTDGVATESVIAQLRGPLGSAIGLVVARHGVDQPFLVSVERAEIKLAFVRWSQIQGPDGNPYGYLQIRGFP